MLTKPRIILSLTFVAIGLVILFYVASPIVFFQLKYATGGSGTSFIAPIPNVLANSIVNLSGVDYTKASNWFPTAKSKKDPLTSSNYWLSIPKLGIEQATVSTISEDLLKNLVHYSGSALPGEVGNTVVFGHSTLPQLFNPKNYKTIFSTLHKLKMEDEMVATVDGITYTYVISEIKIIEPADISVLAQDSDGSYVTLITCTPPGTYWKRLVIKGKLKNLNS